MKMRIIIFCFILLFSFRCLFGNIIDKSKFSTIITLQNNEIIYCNIVSEEDDFYLLQLEDASLKKFPKNEVSLIAKNPLANEHALSISPATGDGFYSSDNLLLGITFLTPGGINLNVGTMDEDFGIRGQVGYIGSAFGSQLDFLLPFYFSSDVAISFVPSLGYSWMEIDEMGNYGPRISVYEWIYVAGGFNANLFGFDLNLGLSLGTGDFTNPQLMFSFGYVHRLDR